MSIDCQPPCRNCGKGLYLTSRANVDPTPNVISYQGIDSRRISDEYAAGLPGRRYENGFGETVIVTAKPRPEYDRNANPILIAFRERRESVPDMRTGRLAAAWLVVLPMISRDLDATGPQIDHARKVLMHLAEMSAS